MYVYRPRKGVLFGDDIFNPLMNLKRNMKKNVYIRPALRSVDLRVESVLLANSFIEGGQEGEEGEADTRRKYQFSSDNWYENDTKSSWY